MKIAVIGSGISGCAAAWELSSWAEVTIFESGSRLGGHTHTQQVTVDGIEFPVDTGFIVFNHRTYPGLKAWFEMLNVETAKSDMSFSASLNQGDIEWCGTNLNTVFAQRKNILSPSFWGMLHDITRFNREAPKDAAVFRGLSGSGPSLGEYLDLHHYGEMFLNAYLLPMAGAIWSCPTQQMRAFPMATFTQFCENHGLLSITNRPQWYSVQNGSNSYIKKLQSRLESLGRQVAWKTDHLVEHVVPMAANGPADKKRVSISGTHGHGLNPSPFNDAFDAVVLACHSDQATQLLPAGCAARKITSQVGYQKNLAVLHTDISLMPKRKNSWASWNYIHDTHGQESSGSVSVTYWMNRLQPLPVATPVLVSLNPVRPPMPSQVINTMEYAHPIFDGPAVQAQRDLPAVQGSDRIWLAGAWTRYGFHEDGFQSGINAARSIQSVLTASANGQEIPKAA